MAAFAEAAEDSHTCAANPPLCLPHLHMAEMTGFPCPTGGRQQKVQHGSS